MQIGSGPIPFRKRDWRKLSPTVQELIQKCLEMDPVERITSEEALLHDWLHEGQDENAE
jgi:serine/threonine protein kinase